MASRGLVAVALTSTLAIPGCGDTTPPPTACERQLQALETRITKLGPDDLQHNEAVSYITGVELRKAVDRALAVCQPNP